MLKLLACFVLLSPIPVLAQNAPKSISLADTSNVPIKDISKALQKECPNVSIANGPANSDYVLEAEKTVHGISRSFDFTLSDRDGKTVRGTSTEGFGSFGDAVKDICRAIKTAVIVEVVDVEDLTQSLDARSEGGIVNAVTGRRTHTDASTMNVIVNGEHALVDCYEHRKGCITIGPGKYYGELDTDRRSIWVDHDIPLTHAHVRDHYVIAGSW